MQKRAGRGIVRATVGCVAAVLAISFALSPRDGRAEDETAIPSPADTLAVKKAAAAQKALAQQKISAVLRARRAQSLRTFAAYDDVFGQGAASQAFGAGASLSSGSNFGLAGSPGSGSAYAGGMPSTGSAGNATGGTGIGSTMTGTGNSRANGGSNQNYGTSQNYGTTIASKIVEFAEEHLGEKVGSGQSKALIDAALKDAGAKPIDDNSGQRSALNAAPNQKSSQNLQNTAQDTSSDVIPLSSAQPGDILKFENAIFVGMNYWMIMGAPTQWAIVYMVRGNEVILLDQDVNGLQLVQYTTINMADLHSGTVTAYRPVADDSSNSGDEPGSNPGASPPGGCRNSSSNGQSGSNSSSSCNKPGGNSSGGTGQQPVTGEPSATNPKLSSAF